MVSIWERETFFAPQDVVIIGSGFVGLWSALRLKEAHPKLKITVVDRGLIPTGASTRNAGFACFGSPSELVWDAQAMGVDKMLRVTEMRFKGLEKIQKTLGPKKIDFELTGGYELYDEAFIPTGKLQEQVEYLNTLLKPVTGKKKTYRFANEKIGDFGFGETFHLIENRLEGYLHPGKLVQALSQKVQGMGMSVLNGLDVTGIERSGNGITLTTSQQINLSSAQLLLCTNAFTKELIPEIDIVPARGQVLLTSPIKNLPFRGTFHAEEGFFYFRNLGDRVLLGGARHKAIADEATADFQTTDFIQHALENYLAKVILPAFQNRYTIEQRWAGIMAFGTEKTPIVRRLEENIFCAARMSGMGVALAPVVAEDVAKMMRG